MSYVLFLKDLIFSAVFESSLVVYVLYLLFIHWLWKYLPFQEFLTKTPLIQGTWKGKFYSNWRDENDNKVSGDVTIIIRQPDLFTLKINQNTQESDSKSISEAIQYEDGNTFLIYTFLNEPQQKFREKSQIHYGSARLCLFKENKNLRLKGRYWTDRESTGDIELEFVSQAITK